ncbi:MAG TPA: bifunctional DNA-formamidopyrimidine glycosylase/DNA-(apurinic or apyrimidinic site) lyase [Sphingomonas sp.]|jgi:formamidopyrimidine-DNA glycosylase|uniref:bifunctional DNA-formamidopyrimidine glycosylase/DNA-(apurinic or apyrimidinic site) lyase n=1 Tax=Sphingomonas sp. TaxID=28214 RepID=UPI002ED83064
MPELPEVETTVRGLRPVLEGQRLTLVEPRRADIRRAIPVDLRQRMTGATVTGLGRRAKYGLIATDRGDTMIFHLGMSGRWRVDPEAIGTHDHLVLETAAGRRLALNDARRFGSIDLVRSDAVDAFAPFRALGPEPLGPAFDAGYLAARLAGRTAPIKALLLDQRIVAGLGNIYVCEALNMAGIAPSAAGGAIRPVRLRALVDAAKAVLLSAIDAGGSTLRDYARPDGELGYFSKQFRVYARAGEACPCGGIVERRPDGGRSTFWCPECQR